MLLLQTQGLKSSPFLVCKAQSDPHRKRILHPVPCSPPGKQAAGRGDRFCRLRLSATGNSAPNGALGAQGRSSSLSNHDAVRQTKRPQIERGPFDNTYIWQLIWQQKGHIFIAGVALVICVACNLASPLVTGRLFEILVGKSSGGVQSYKSFFALMAGLYIIEPLMTRVYIINVCTLAEKVLASLRAELFRILLLQKIEFFDVHSATRLTSLISGELESVRNFVFRNVSRDRGPRAFLEASGAVIVLFALSWRLGPILAAVIVATAVAASIYRTQTRGVERDNADAAAEMNRVANQAFEAITTVRSFAGESLERERFGEHVQKSLRCGLGFGVAKANLESFNRSAIHVSLIALYGLGGWLVNQGLMPFRVLASAIGYTFSLVFATQGILGTTTEYQRMLSSVKRIQEILGQSNVDPSMNGALPPGAWWEYISTGRAPPPAEPYGVHAGDAAVTAAKVGSLELQGVCFTYPLRQGRPVLQDLDLTLSRGTVTALVGRSGAGKSTVAALLARFYAPQKGDILLNGQRATSFTRGEWARAVSVVQQEPILFGGSIADNIAYGRYGRCSQSEIESAARAANAHEFIKQLPEGYETNTGERGALLSGGQRQRIALARALIKDSPIIILDEATSALDAVSEQLVQQAIEKLVFGRTVLVIAHRLSTVQAAKQIVVLDNGRVAEIGTHDQLVERGNLYSELVSTQSLSLSLSV